MKKIKFKVFLLIFFLVSSSSVLIREVNGSNSLKCEWYRIWGGDSDDIGTGVGMDSSGNVYLVGTTSSFGLGSADMVLVKYDCSGAQQWNHTWGGVSNDYCRGLAIDFSENLLLVGSTESFGAGQEDMVLVKYNRNGTMQWNTTWGGGDFDRCYEGTTDSSGNVYLVGTTRSFGLGDGDIVLIKFDENGVQQWNRTWGGTSHEEGRGLVVDSLGNIYLTGQSESFGAGNRDIVLIKYDKNGIQQWNTTWGGFEQDIGHAVVVDSSGNIYLTGQSESFKVFSSKPDAIVIKYDSDGIQLWNRTWGGTSGQAFGKALAIDSSENVCLVGEIEEYGVYDIFIVKYDQNGTQLLNYLWGGADDDFCLGVVIDVSDNLYLAGYTSYETGKNDMILLKYRPYIASNSILSYDLFIIMIVLGISTFFWRKKKFTKK